MVTGIRSLTATVMKIKEVQHGFFDMELHLPEIASHCSPGQFMMIKASATMTPFLGRPMGIYDWNEQKGTVSILFAVQGHNKGTEHLSLAKPGDELGVVAPLGRGYKFYDTDKKVIAIAGGMGIASLYPVIKHLNSTNTKVEMMMGAHHAGNILALDKLAQLDVEIKIYTDNGSMGIKGWPTDTLKEMLKTKEYDRVYCCGTMRMLENTSNICEEAGVPCQVSMEERMGCGIGICMGCVCHHRRPDGTADIARICYEGPVFDSKEVIWHG